MSDQPARPDIEVVLFDMGGVLVELAPLEDLLGFAGMTADDFWPRWLSSPSVRALESGRCDMEAFGRGLVAELDLAVDPAEVIERFATFPRGLYPGAVELVESVASIVETGLLSNTNATHWETQIDGPTIRGLCHHAFLSYRLGLLKPDRALFDRVVSDLGRTADRILFLDDNLINVEGARAAGLRAEVVHGPGEAAAVLEAYDLRRG